MGFFRKSPEEKEARAALNAEKDRLRIAKLQTKAAKTALKASHVEERELDAVDRLERDRRRTRAKPVRVRGSRRARGFRRARPRRGGASRRTGYRGGARYE
jgi:hypothetical protein